MESKLLPRLTRLQRMNIDSNAAFQRVCDNVVHKFIGPCASSLVSDLAAVDDFMDEVLELQTRNDYLTAVEEDGWEIRQAEDGDYYGINLDGTESVRGERFSHDPSSGAVDIDWAAFLARHYPDVQLFDTYNANEEDKVPLNLTDGITSFDGAGSLLDLLTEQLNIEEKDLLAKLKPFVLTRETGVYSANSEEEAAKELAEEERIEPHTDEAYEHWIVASDWFADKLQTEGEIIGELRGLTIWGRCTTGQSISMDGVIKSIVGQHFGSELDEMMAKEFPSLDNPSPDNDDFQMHEMVLNAVECRGEGAAFKLQLHVRRDDSAPEDEDDYVETFLAILDPRDTSKGWLLDINYRFDKSANTPDASRSIEELIAKQPRGHARTHSGTKHELTQEDLDRITKELGHAHKINAQDPQSYTAPKDIQQRLAALSPAYALEHGIQPAPDAGVGSANDTPVPY